MRHHALTFFLHSVIGLALAPALASAQAGVARDSAPVIEAAGSARVTLTPDRAVVRFAVTSSAATAAQAAALNSPRVRRVVTSLEARRSPQESVTVIAVSVGPNENYQRGTIVDYRATAVVRLLVRSLDSLGRFLDVALTNGATEVTDVVFESDRADAARREALARAYAEAHANAEALATAAGGHLGPLLRLSTGPDYSARFDVEAVAYMSVGRAGAPVPLAPQDVVVTAAVSAVWRFIASPR